MTLIDAAKLRNSRIVRVLDAYNVKRVADIKHLKSISVAQNQDGFYAHKGEFIVAAPVDQLWHLYMHCSPVLMWNNRFMEFIMLYNSTTESLFYGDAEHFPSMEEGMRVFINVHFLSGTVRIPVGHEVDLIDEKNRLIKTNYLENSKSTGSQYIRFIADGANRTRIIHDSYYRSGSLFRDKILYPTLHSLTIGAFHNNLKRMLVEQGTEKISMN